MSIYSSLKDRLDVTRLEDMPRIGNREASLFLVENEGGDPLLGIKYHCDARSEEETGSGQMSTSFTQTADKDSFVAKEYLLQDNNSGLSAYKQAELVFAGENYVAFSSDIYASKDRLKAELPHAIAFIRNAERYSTGIADIERKLWRKTVAELKAQAKELGLKGYSKLKRAELENALAKKIQEASGVVIPESYTQPAWFHYGSFLIFERKAGTVFAEVLDKLVEAAQAGALIVGGGSIGFGSGFSFFDSRDLSQESVERIHNQNVWYREQMALLAPVAEIVKKKHGYYALGSPNQFSEGPVKYWLNGHSLRAATGRSHQPYGWYTLQELKDEKYLEDMEEAAKESYERFDDSGNYRTKAA